MPLRRPKPTARLMPVLKVTLMMPASATRPDAVTVALLDAIWPLLMPIETAAPLLQAALDEEIWTFHAPSKRGAGRRRRCSGKAGEAVLWRRWLL